MTIGDSACPGSRTGDEQLELPELSSSTTDKSGILIAQYSDGLSWKTMGCSVPISNATLSRSGSFSEWQGCNNNGDSADVLSSGKDSGDGSAQDLRRWPGDFKINGELMELSWVSFMESVLWESSRLDPKIMLANLEPVKSGKRNLERDVLSVSILQLLGLRVGVSVEKLI